MKTIRTLLVVVVVAILASFVTCNNNENVISVDDIDAILSQSPSINNEYPIESVEPEPTKPVNSDPAIPALLSMLKSSNVDLSKFTIVDTETKGRGLIANENISINTTIFSIPLSLIITIDKIQKKSSISSWLIDKHPTDVFALWLAHNRHNTKSKYFPYLSSLPPFVPLPLFYSKYLVNETQGTVLEELLTTRRTIAYKAYQGFEKEIKSEISQADFLWAISIVWSRSFSIAKKMIDKENNNKISWISKSALIPLVDFINTGNSTEINIKCKTSRDGQEFQCQSIKNINKGEELLISYGKRSSSQLLHDYGFTLFNNENDYVEINLPSPKYHPQPKDSHQVSRRKGEVEDSLIHSMIVKNNLLTLKLFSPPVINTSIPITNISLNEFISNDILGWSRLNMIDKWDIEELVAYEMIDSIMTGKSISYNNDLKSCQFLIDIIKKSLINKYSTKIEADLAALNSNELAQSNTALYWITLVRYYEKSVLLDVQALLEEKMASLAVQAEEETKERKQKVAVKKKEIEEKKRKEIERKAEKERKRKLSLKKSLLEDDEDKFDNTKQSSSSSSHQELR